MFQPFEGSPDYPSLETRVLRFWKEHGIFDRLRQQNASGKAWNFQDGPITANNPMGVHHAWGRTYKDIFSRYHAMRGRKLRWQNGFDCQGLWVEVEVEKALGFKGKTDILAFGMEEFSRACRARVEEYAGVISHQSERLGQWMDWERSYFTFDDSNIEHIWLFLKTCHDEGWLSPDYRVMPWCPRCETSLSQHESSDAYKEITHRSVYVKLPISGAFQDASRVEEDVRASTFNPPSSLDDAPKAAEPHDVTPSRFAGDAFLAWTTTPWTLTANVALALNPGLTYVRAKSGDDVLILSKETVASALKPGYEVLEEVSGAELVGLIYGGPFDDIGLQSASQAKAPRRSVAWDDVGEAEGTGIVHIAPGCGAEDFELGRREGLGFVVPVDGSGRFLPGAGELEGLHALENVEDVFAALEKRGRMYRVQRYKHSYPHCWRCGTELLFRAVQEWFIRADAGERPARERLRRAAREVKWTPEYAGKRMDNWLESMGDWCISRKRFWGLPLPFYVDEHGGNLEVIGSREELIARAVEPERARALPELHRPWIDEVAIYARDGKTVLRRVPEVGDAWLDAGIVPFATVGYNGSDDIRMPELKLRDKSEWRPVAFITEMREQVRLWFFSMLWMSVALEDRAPYQAAMVYETMLDENGERISKTKKNGVPFDRAVQGIGADPIRWNFCSNPLNKDIRFGPSDPERMDAWISRSKRDLGSRLLTLWNVYSFFVTYANLDKPKLTGEVPRPENVLDKWILARLQQTISSVTNALELPEPADASRSVEAFVDDLSNWYVRRSRRRFWKSESDSDKADAYATLHHVLLTVCKLVAPIIPFSAEELYGNLKHPLSDAPISVHLCAWPQVNEELRDDALCARVEAVLQAVSLGHAARKESNVRVRQPLAKVLVQAPSESARDGVTQWRDAVLDELNVKDLELLSDAGELVSYSLRANLPKLGPKFGKRVGEIRKALESASLEEARRIGELVKRGENVTLQVGDDELTLAPDEVLVSTQQRGGYAFASENGWAVGFDTELTPHLLDEGTARDFIRAVQGARKDAGFQVSDRIAILLAHDETSSMPRVFDGFGEEIQRETLADELRLVPMDYPELLEAKVGDETVRLRVELLTS